MTDARPRILVNVDDSKEGDTVLGVAGLLARRLDADVALFTTGRRDRKRELLFELGERLLDMPAPGRVTKIAKEGLLERALPEACREWGADVAVVGRLGSLDWLTHGLVLTHVVRKVPCSLVHVKAGRKRMERLLVCTSGPASEETVRGALTLAAATGAVLTVLHVLSVLRLETSRFEEERDMVEELIRLEAEVRSHLDAVRAWAHAKNVPLEVKLRTGLIEEEILEETKRGPYDLLVVGAHTPGPEAHLTRDIADWLVHHANMTTLIVKPRG